MKRKSATNARPRLRCLLLVVVYENRKRNKRCQQASQIQKRQKVCPTDNEKAGCHEVLSCIAFCFWYAFEAVHESRPAETLRQLVSVRIRVSIGVREWIAVKFNFLLRKRGRQNIIQFEHEYRCRHSRNSQHHHQHRTTLRNHHIDSDFLAIRMKHHQYNQYTYWNANNS